MSGKNLRVVSKTALSNRIVPTWVFFPARTLPTSHRGVRLERDVRRRTSEYWYEEEEEFDAAKDILVPKLIIVVAMSDTSMDSGIILNFLSSITTIASLFSTELVAKTAEDVWKGRRESKAPYFKKVRVRDQVTWEELISQNWRVELDYGLGLEIPSKECLVVLSHQPDSLEDECIELGEAVVISVEGREGGHWSALERKLVWKGRVGEVELNAALLG